MKIKNICQFTFSFLIVLWVHCPIVVFLVLAILGAYRKDESTVFVGFILGCALTLPRFLLKALNIVNVDSYYYQHYQSLKSFFHRGVNTNHVEKIYDSAIQIIYHRNIFFWATSLTIEIADAKFPRLFFAIETPLTIPVESGDHEIILSDNEYSQFNYHCNIVTSPDYIVRITYRAKNNFLMCRKGQVLIEYIPTTEK